MEETCPKCHKPKWSKQVRGESCVCLPPIKAPIKLQPIDPYVPDTSQWNWD